jgi:uncharacterized protein (TIGR02145 family)/uncharacterized repeat protein (TIGR02543 family)
MKNIVTLLVFASIAALLTCEKIPDYCGKKAAYDPSCQFCFGGNAYNHCNGMDYNPLTEGCVPTGDAVGTRCQDESIVPRGTPCGGYTLTVAATPAGGGKVALTPEKPSYGSGDEPVLSAFAESGYMFVGWAGAVTSTEAVTPVRMSGNSANKPVVAIFKPVGVGKLFTEAFPQDAGLVTRKPDREDYDDGETVTVSAVEAPGSGYVFDGWSGASTSKSTTVTVTMDESKTLVAIFSPVSYSFKASANPADGGAVFVNGAALLSGDDARYVGTEIEVLARAADGYEFVNWSGAVADGAEWRTSDNATISVTTGMTLTANFRPAGGPEPVYAVTVSSAGGGVSVSGYYVRGSTVPINATVPAGYRFDGWTTVSRGVSFEDANSAATTFVMPGNAVVVTANFAQNTTPPDGDVEYVTIGGVKWMSKNLNVETAVGSWCYDDNPANCNQYGRLYTWAAAMGLEASYNSNTWGGSDVNHRGICPVGWHLPSDDEWDELMEAVGGYSTAGTMLKSKSGWYNNGNGTDEFGFSALPGGRRNPDGDFGGAGDLGHWWTATERVAAYAYYRYMGFNYDDVDEDDCNKEYGFAVRCVGD